MQAGKYRTTFPILPPSAAWGLVLNLAGIETRKPSDQTTLIDPNAPPLKLCVGVANLEGKGTLFQQLHSYPVGNSGKEFKEKTFGNKYWIAPIHREILVGLNAVVGVEAENDLLQRIQEGLRGDFNEDRYGLPFAGDNNLLFDRIDLWDEPPLAIHWYSRLEQGDKPRRGSCRVTVGIDREDSSKTTTALVAPLESPEKYPPERAWFWVPHQP